MMHCLTFPVYLLLALSTYNLPPGSDLELAQRMVERLQATGQPSTIVLDGEYAWDGTLSITGNPSVSIRGEHATVTQLREDTRTIYWTQSDDWSCQGVHFVGRGTEKPWAQGSAPNAVAGVRFRSCKRARIERNRFTNHAGRSIGYDGTGCEDIQICHNVIVGMGPDHIKQGENGADGGISQVAGIGTSGRGLSICHNMISGHAHGILGGGSFSSLIISQNIITDIPGQHGMYISPRQDAVIANNAISRTGHDGIKITHGVACAAPVLVIGNTIHQAGDSAIKCNRPSGEGMRSNVTLTGNVIVGCRFGILCYHQDGIRILDNTISGSTGMCFQSVSSSGTVRGTEFRNCRTGFVQDTPAGDWVYEDLDFIDTPNVATVGSATRSSCMTLRSGDIATTTYLHGVRLRYQDLAEPPDLLYGINADGQLLTVRTGVLWNQTTKRHRVVGSLVEAIAVESAWDRVPPAKEE